MVVSTTMYVKVKVVLGIILTLFLVTTFTVGYNFPQVIAKQDSLGVQATEDSTYPKDFPSLRNHNNYK